MDIHKGTITFDSGRGWFYAEDLEDGISVYVHMAHSADEKCLHVHDTITFQRVDSTAKPGKHEAREVRRFGLFIAPQVGGDRAGRS
jgi:hypothetical protein